MVLPSDTGETWGLVVNEAMACGLPALVSDQVGCRQDLILENQTGWSFPCGNIDTLAQKLKDIALLPPDTLKSIGQYARNHVAAYSPEAAARGTVAAAVGRGQRTPPISTEFVLVRGQFPLHLCSFPCFDMNEASPGQALSPRARLLLRRSGVSSKCCFIESAASGGELDP
jgi:hypothetical protein